MVMKTSRIVTTLFGASLLYAAAAFAQEKSTLTLTDKVNVQGTELKAGKYEVEWEGSGPTVQVNIRKGKTVVTVPATLAAKQTANLTSGYGARTEADGTRSLFAIIPAGKKYELEISDKQATATAAK
jgi:hypothetical protein